MLLRLLKPVLAVAILLSGSASAQFLPCYHSPEEILAEIDSLKHAHPDLFRVDTLAYTNHFRQPVIAVNFSQGDNPALVKPSVLIIGQVHGEELIGVELVMKLITDLCATVGNDSTRVRLQSVDLVMIPTLNPDGLKVVADGLDDSYRKNCRDNVGDGRLRYQQDVGGDTSGVDLNRNFGLHWDRGDSLLIRLPGVDEYNFYRGLAPFSEPETDAVRALITKRKFTYALSYHGSRSGRNAERIIGPWNWEGKHPPDDIAIHALGGEISARIPTEDGFTNYLNTRATLRVGQEQDWAYQTTGCYMYMIELGDTFRPDSALLARQLTNFSPSFYFLLDAARGAAAVAGCGILKVHVGGVEPDIPVEVVVGNSRSPLLEPRFLPGDAHRWYYQILPASYRKVQILADGYAPIVFDSARIISGDITFIDTTLTPLTQCTVRFECFDRTSGAALDARIFIDNAQEPTLSPEVDLPIGPHSVLILREGFVPRMDSFNVASDSLFRFDLMQGAPRFVEEFDDLPLWEHGGAGEDWGVVTADDRSCLTDSKSGPYEWLCSGYIAIPTGVVAELDHSQVLRMVHRPYFEPGADRGNVNVWDYSTSSWVTVASYSEFDKGRFDTSFISLNAFEFDHQQIVLELQVRSDNTVEEDGWLIDDLELYYSDYDLPVSQPYIPSGGGIVSLFPNPSNGSTILSFDSHFQFSGQVAIYDLTGRQLLNFSTQIPSPGLHRLLLPTTLLPTGRYFVRLNSASRLDQYPSLPLTIVK